MGTVASSSNFDDGSEIGMDPFTGLAPDATEEDRERARKAKLRADAIAAANINVNAGGAGRGRATGGRQQSPTGAFYTGAERPTAPGHDLNSFLTESAKTVQQHPWLPLLPLAPLAASSLAPAAATFGGGVPAGSAGLPSASSVVGAPFSVASPHVAGTATGLTGAAGATGATAATAATAGQAAADAWNWKDTVHVATPIVGTALDYGLRAIFGGDSNKENKALLAKQEQMARETAQRRDQAAQSRMDALGQQVLAFNPLNQAMAEMYGPGAAFTPEQAAGMVQNPAGAPRLDSALIDYRGNDPKKRAQIDDWSRRYKEYDAAEAARKDKVMGGFQQPGPGPAPLKPITPLPARRY